MADPIVLNFPAVFAEANSASLKGDDDLLARDALAAVNAGDARRADALSCARALLAERRGEPAAAFALWRDVFQQDPTLSFAFWGLRRALVRQKSWDELVGVIDRRIVAVDAPGRADHRADLWMERGRVLEDRLGRDEDAAKSYRAGLMEAPDHPALLTSNLLLGFRRGDRDMIAEALAGLLRRPLPQALRASTAARLARLDRDGGAGVARAGSAVLDAVTSERALSTLRAALRAVSPDEAGPLLTELSSLMKVTVDPAARVELLEEMVSQSGASASTARAMAASEEDVVSMLRERARLLRDHLHDPDAADESLRAALKRAPGHPRIAADLADRIEASGRVGKRDGGTTDAAALGDLLATVAPGDRAFESGAEAELAIRYAGALVRGERAAEALSFLDRHPELPRERPDVFALDVMCRVQTNDPVGLATTFERAARWAVASRPESDVGDKGGDATADDREFAAHALVVGGVLRERAARWRSNDNDNHSDDNTNTDDAADAARLYREALDIAPGYGPALAAVERGLWQGERWRELVDLWQARLARLPAGIAGSDDERSEKARMLENLVSVYRDLLDDPVNARRIQDERLATGEPSSLRDWVRRHDLELAAGARGEWSPAGTRVRILCELANGSRAPDVAAAFRIDAARIAGDEGDVATAEILFKQALAADPEGLAAAGLERLATGTDPAATAKRRAGRVSAEIARVEAGATDVEGRADRLRALRFRLAWHAVAALNPTDAVSALAPLCAAGDSLARGWSWEIARRSGDVPLMLKTSPSLSSVSSSPSITSGRVHSDGLEAAVDVAETLERSGDPERAAAAYRAAIAVESSSELALGLLRTGAVLGHAPTVAEAVAELARLAEPATAPGLKVEAELLALLQVTMRADTADTPAALPASDGKGGEGTSGDGDDDPMGTVLRWARGVKSADAFAAAVGLLAVGRSVRAEDAPDALDDRDQMLSRAAARARVGGGNLAGAVHDQTYALSPGAAAVVVGLADLPVGGKPHRIAARAARAQRHGGALAYALDMECALDAETRADGRGALEHFASALARDPEGIEALDGIKRLATAAGDRLGAARASLRMGAVLRTPARAAAEFSTAGLILEDVALPTEAAVAYWQALKHDPGSSWLFERLRLLLGAAEDGHDLDRLYQHRLDALSDSRERAALLVERGAHRLRKLGDSHAAIEDFKRVLRIDPDQREALRHLATLAVQMGRLPSAIRFLERLITLESDVAQACRLRLELADAYQAAGEPSHAAEVLRSAASARPRDIAPWQRLTDLLLRLGDGSGALATLRSWDAVLDDPAAKAEIRIRIGCLLRDDANDTTAAANAFRAAVELDPLGEAIFHLVALLEQTHADADAGAAVRAALFEASALLRPSLFADPGDLLRLRRWKVLHEKLAEAARSSEAPILPSVGSADTAAERERGRALTVGLVGATVAAQILALAEKTADPSVAAAPGLPLGGLPVGAEFWSWLRPPGADGLAADVWPLLAPAAVYLIPAAQARPHPRERITTASQAGLGWVEAVAVAIGVPDVELFLTKTAAGAGGGLDVTVVPLDGTPPGLLVGAGVAAGDAEARFRVGRALGLLRDRAAVFDRMSANDLGSLLAAAAVVAGVSPTGAPDAAKAIERQAKLLTKAMARKDRKALELEKSRFGFEPVDASAFRHAILTSADRLGLVVAGNVAVAVRAVASSGGDPAATPPFSALVANPRALDLIRFSLGHAYAELLRPEAAGTMG